MWYSIVAGLGIGLLGSIHCIGMCGPIALSLPIYGKSSIEKLLLIVLYNLGRASAYALLGAIFGFIGNQFFLFGYQRIFSVSIGVLLLLILFFGPLLQSRISLFDRLYQWLQVRLSVLLQSSKNTFSYFFIGFANGFLPCGLVYLAIGSALSTGSPMAGAALLFLFGLGTFPLMLTLMLFGRAIPLSLRNKLRKLVPVFIFLTASLIIVRGLNLGIPYLSPQVNEQAQGSFQQVKCHPNKP